MSRDDRTAPVSNDLGTYAQSTDREITGLSDVADASCGYCLTIAESTDAGVMQLSAADVVTADDLLHAVSNSHLNTVSNGSQQSSCTGRITETNTEIIADNSLDADTCDRSPDLHLGRVGFRARLRVNVENLTELELWQKGFAERSKTTMRYANVSLCTGKKTLYKVNI